MYIEYHILKSNVYARVCKMVCVGYMKNQFCVTIVYNLDYPKTYKHEN